MNRIFCKTKNAQVDANILMDSDLSLEAKGVYALIVSLLNDGLSVSRDILQYWAGKESVDDALIELNEKGYTYVV